MARTVGMVMATTSNHQQQTGGRKEKANVVQNRPPRAITQAKTFEFGQGHMLFSETQRKSEERRKNKHKVATFRKRKRDVEKQELKRKIKPLEKEKTMQQNVASKVKVTFTKKIEKLMLENQKMKMKK